MPYPASFNYTDNNFKWSALCPVSGADNNEIFIKRIVVGSSEGLTFQPSTSGIIKGTFGIMDPDTHLGRVSADGVIGDNGHKITFDINNKANIDNGPGGNAGILSITGGRILTSTATNVTSMIVNIETDIGTFCSPKQVNPLGFARIANFNDFSVVKKNQNYCSSNSMFSFDGANRNPSIMVDKISLECSNGVEFLDNPTSITQPSEGNKVIFGTAGASNNNESYDYEISNDKRTITFTFGKPVHFFSNLIGDLDFRVYRKLTRDYTSIITISTSEGTFTKQYTKKILGDPPVQTGRVYVKYVDTDNKEIASTDVKTGVVGTTYTTTAKKIEGYRLKETPTNANGTYKSYTQYVTYVYEPEGEGAVMVTYKDEKGNKLADPEILTGKIGSSYETEIKAIPGYEVKNIPDNAKGKFTENEQVVNYVYTKSSESKLKIQATTYESDKLTDIWLMNRSSSSVSVDKVVLKNSDSNVAIPKILSAKIVGVNSKPISDADVVQEKDQVIVIPRKPVFIATESDANDVWVECTLADNYEEHLPTNSYTTSITWFTSERTVEKSFPNLFGIKKIEPDYVVEVPKSIDFTDTRTTENARIRLLNKEGNLYTGAFKATVKVKSVNDFKLKDNATKNLLPYKLTYNYKDISSSNNTIGTLSNETSEIDGIAKLLKKDESNLKYRYTDTLTYTIENEQ